MFNYLVKFFSSINVSAEIIRLTFLERELAIILGARSEGLCVIRRADELQSYVMDY
jgi:hypothetical protein